MAQTELTTEFKDTSLTACETCCGSGGLDERETTQTTSFFSSGLKVWAAPAFSFMLLMAGLLFDHYWTPSFFDGPLRLAWYLVAYIPVAWPVLKKGFTLLKQGDVFTEFFLMGIATIGAFLIGEYPEGVAVMLFYTVGELFQDSAVSRAKQNIRSLLDVRADTAHIEEENTVRTTDPRTISPGAIIRVKPGEKVPLDGELLSESGTFNTSALTGESIPRYSEQGETILSGMINQDALIRLRVTKPFEESAISKILELIQNASSRKAKTEQFIRRFSRVYTPAVTLFAVLLVVVPYFAVESYVFSDWLYRSLVFLVISCPCALVISIPLGYFGGIGAASKNGILFKGANYLDRMPSVNTVVMDKTGTLTEGKFSVERVISDEENNDWLLFAAAAEKDSSHPVAKAITIHAEEELNGSLPAVQSMTEVSGLGVIARIDGKTVVAGNTRLLERENIQVPDEARREAETVVCVAVDGDYKGYIVISDTIKEDAAEAVSELRKYGVRQIVILSGDKNAVVQKVAEKLGITTAFGELYPEDKLRKLEEIKRAEGAVVAYAGDGINDAPSLALSDVGIAMGALGSDAAIESADVVIQTDQPSKIATSMKIGRSTKRIVWQNITLAMGVKGAVLALGAAGMASLWGAVFADVGVALLAVLNAVRVQRMKF